MHAVTPLQDPNLQKIWPTFLLRKHHMQEAPPREAPSTEIRSWFQNSAKSLRALRKIYTLDLSSLGLTAIPLEIFLCKNLEVLNLSNNQITKIPPEIEQCTKLRTLNLENNLLTQTAKQMAKLPQLIDIFLFGNSLTQEVPVVPQVMVRYNLAFTIHEGSSAKPATPPPQTIVLAQQDQEDSDISIIDPNEIEEDTDYEFISTNEEDLNRSILF